MLQPEDTVTHCDTKILVNLMILCVYLQINYLKDLESMLMPEFYLTKDKVNSEL